MLCGANTTCSSALALTLMSGVDPVNTTQGADEVTRSAENISVVNGSNHDITTSLCGIVSVSDSTENVTSLPLLKIPTSELSLIMAAAVLTTTCNLIVLTASKFTSGGKSPTLVFIRSLCVSDSLIGVYGIFKIAMYMCVDQLLMNFFLAESLFFTASFASGLSLLALNIDCCMKLAEPLNYGSQMDKKNVITIMVMLWNLSFIAGFLPQMGWRENGGQYHVLQFFVFHPWHYLLFFSLILLVIFGLNIVITLYMKKKIALIQSNRSFLSPNSTKFQKYHTLVITAGIDMVSWILCYLPFFVYLAIYCNVCYFKEKEAAERNIVYFIPVFLTKSFISGIVHGYRTAQIHDVMKRFSRQFSKIVQNSRKRRRKGLPMTSNGRSNSASIRSVQVDLNEIDGDATQSTMASGGSDDIEVISSQLTLYSSGQSNSDGDSIYNSVMTRL